MRVTEFCDDSWHDQQGGSDNLLHWDEVFQTYQKAAVILDRMLGKEVRQSVGPLVFGLKLLEFISQISITEEKDGLFTLTIFNKAMQPKKLEELVKGKVGITLLEERIIGEYSTAVEKSPQISLN